MNGRNQPYLDTNGAGFYEPTMWQDEVEGIQEGTPVDEQKAKSGRYDGLRRAVP